MKRHGIIVRQLLLAWLIMALGLPLARAQVTNFNVAADFLQLKLNWNQYSGATGYEVYWQTTPGVTTSSTKIVTGSTTVSYIHTGLTAGTTIYYAVRAILAGPSYSNLSSEKFATPLALTGYFAGATGDGHTANTSCMMKPDGTSVAVGVTNLTAAASLNANVLYWDYTSGASSYNIQRSTDIAFGTHTDFSTSNICYTDATAVVGTAYYYRVQPVLSGCSVNWVTTASTVTAVSPAHIAGGTGDGHSTIRTCTILPDGTAVIASPTGLTVAASLGSNVLYWNILAGATSYTLRWSNVSNFSTYTDITSITDLSYVHTSLTPGTTYYYRVTAVMPGGCPVGFSSDVSAIPAVLTHLAGGSGDGHSANVTCSIDLNGNSQTPGPSGLVAASSLLSNVLYWNILAGATSYTLQWSLSPSFSSPTNITGITNLSYVHTGITPGTTYYYQVTAVSGSCPLGYSNSVNATPVSVAHITGGSGDGFSANLSCSIDLGGNSQTPGPANLVVASGLESSNMYWDVMAGATSYTVRWSTDAGFSTYTDVTGLTTISWVHTGCTPGTQYFYKTTATTGGGCPVGFSNSGSSTPANDAHITGGNGEGYAGNKSCMIALTGSSIIVSPTNLNVASSILSDVLYWDPNPDFVNYTVRWSTDPGFGTYTDTTGLTTGSWVHTPITAGTTYYYKVTGSMGGTCTADFTAPVSGIPVSAAFNAGGSGDGYASFASCAAAGTLNGFDPTVTPAGPVMLCSGQSTVLTSSSAYSYQWYLNGAIISGETSQSYTVSGPGSYTVMITDQISACQAWSLAVVATNGITPAFTTHPSDQNGCDGFATSFSVGATNALNYQWMLSTDGGATWSNTPTGSPYSGITSATLLVNPALIAMSNYRYKCQVSNTCSTSSNPATLTVNPNVSPAVAIGASPAGAICAGTSVTFTASPTNGGTPTYQWQLNGSNTVTGTTYSSSLLADNDVVSCTMISNASCVSPATATSSITMTVNPVLTPAISILPSPAGAICTGTPVTFTASPVNGGTPTYQWKLNGSNTVTGSTYNSSTLSNNDVVSCVMVSNATCANPVTATSSLTITVNPAVTPSVSILPSPAGAICPGTLVTFTASPVNGGTPTYQWKLNGTNTVTGTSYNSSTLSNNDVVSCEMISNATCANPVTATSSVTMNVKTLSVAPTGASALPALICAGSSSTLSVTGGTLGTGASWEWYSASCGGASVGSGASISVSPTANTTYFVRSEGDCNNTLCESVTVTVKTMSVAPTAASALPSAICNGSSATLSFTGGSLGTNATWQWYSGNCGGTPAGTGTSIVVSPASTSTYYVRAEGDCNNTPCVSTVVTVNFCLVSWTGNVSSDWNNAANWSSGVVPTGTVDVSIPAGRPYQPEIVATAQCQGLTIASGAVLTIRPHAALTARGTTTLNGAQCMVIKSIATGTGSFIDNGTITGAGTAKVERYITANFWHYVSSPIQTATAAVYNGQYLKKWLEPTYTWQNITSPSTPLVVGTGYALKSLTTNTYNYIGKLNTGSYSWPVTRNTTQIASKRGWNLKGNPYPSAINWDAPAGWTKTNVYNSVYIYNQTYGTYATYVNGLGTNGASAYIAAGQGFFVVCSASPGGTLGLDNNVRVHKDTTFFKSSFVPDMVRLNLEDNGTTDDIIINIDPDATNAFDSDFDAFKMVVPGISQLWSNPLQGEQADYAINSLPDVLSNPEVPVSFLPAHSGNYIIRASDHDALGYQTSIYLEDLKTGVLADLLDNPTYAFNAAPGDDVNRFVLHFGMPVISGIGQSQDDIRVSIFPNPVKELLNVMIAGKTETAELTITDNLGRVLYRTSTDLVSGVSRITIDISEFASGLYLLNIRTNNENRVTSFVKN